MVMEKLSITDIKDHDGYASTIKSGNTVWNARSTQVINKDNDDDDYEMTNSLKIKSLEKKLDLLQTTLDTVLDRLPLSNSGWR
jgi:hypothetical protein|tara:strand:- start:1762 stop:2010 length:249 start_codon:yes stop_codon:yes gene_type:complete